ncbi:DUF2892 domain-containing protein (plasmid) [Paracoccus methylovorus]|uniref:DUF2892 domain-containing protein n=1 Tax=Paracoccus methylovorus TaxID=2812658 RepID=A0ABX7JM26_9RHOB|nr:MULTISPECIES: YgaP-like transmembrane domain [Paracoccus]QRZ14383.1 DUF2892 domain-containing protein [Paracoccus methylovorus]
MQINIGSTERALRLILGVVLVLLPFLTALSMLWTWVSVIAGLVLVVTGVVRFCPLWAMLGICTAGRK